MPRDIAKGSNMRNDDKGIHIEDDDARAGETPGVMRWVLGISMLLAVIAMTLVWVIPAMMETDVETQGTATGRTEEMREDGVPAEDIPGQSDDNPDLPPTSASTADPDQ
jgi:hypothetical protein